jgi:gliding motility-associated-like protein
VLATGGVAPYTYNWYLESDPSQLIDGQNTNSVSNLWVDVFVLQVIDSIGCVAYDTIAILDDSGLDFDYTIVHHEWCPQSGDGEAFVYNITLPDSVNPLVNYSTFWMLGADTVHVGDTNSNLFVDNYKMVIQENTKGCKVVKPLIMYDKDRLRYDKDSVMNFVQTGSPVGAAYLKPYGGDTSMVDKYYVTWYRDLAATDTIGVTDTIQVYGDVSSTDKYEYLDKGVYYVSLENNRKDGKICMLWDSIHITDDTINYIIIDSSNVYCYGENTGFIEILAQGGSKNGYTYKWDNQNWSEDADSTNNKITNLTAGTYYLTITDADPRGGSITDSIIIGQPDSPYLVNFDLINQPSCIDSTGIVSIIEPIDQGGSAPYNYEWYYNNDTIFNDTIKNLWVNTYYVKVTDARGCEVNDSYYLMDNSPFSIEAKTTSLANICFGDSTGGVQVDILVEGSRSYLYSWFEGNNADTLSTDSIVNDLKAEMYHVTVVDSMGCIRFDSIEVEQFDKIDFSITDTVLNECYTDISGSITFSDVVGGSAAGYTYYMINSEGETVFQDDPIFTNVSTNDYNLLVSAGQCYSDSISFLFLSTSPQMIPSFEIIDTASCNNYTDDGKMAVEIEIGYFDQVSPTLVNEVITYNYQWDGNPALTNDTLSSALAGSHLVLVTDNWGCAETFSSSMPSLNQVWIEEAYVLNSGLSDDYLCPNDTIQLFAESVEPDSIVWNNEQYIVGSARESLIEVVSNITQTFLATAYYKGCRDVDTVLVGRYTIDTLMASIGDDEEKILAGNEIILMANTPDVSYPESLNFDVEHSFTWTASHSGVEWNPSPPDSIEVTAWPSESALFTVYDSIEITNLTYSNQVCFSTDTVSIIVLPDFDPPQGFSPNGDGSNDEWRLSGIDGYDNVSVQIYNRWGGLVWEQDGTYNSNRWTGENSKGKALPSGTYYYIIKYGDSDSGTKTLTGPITIVR